MECSEFIASKAHNNSPAQNSVTPISRTDCFIRVFWLEVFALDQMGFTYFCDGNDILELDNEGSTLLLFLNNTHQVECSATSIQQVIL